MTQNDGEMLYQLDQDIEVMRFINGGKRTTRDEITNVLLPRMKSYTTPERGWGIWAVFLKETNQYIGWILVRPMDFFSDKPQFDNLELGWRFERASWGKGYATEAAKAIADELARKTDIKKFCAIADEDNYGSIGIMKKLGMTFIKQYIHHDPLGDWDVVYYERSIAK